LSSTFDALSKATQPQATTHSSTAARVAFRASSILNFFSFISTSEAAQTLITATPQASFANLSCNFSLSYFESVFSIALFISFILFSICFLSPSQPIMVVFPFSEITLLAQPKSLKVAFSNFIQSSEVMILAQVKIAISFNISFFLSPNQGAFTPSMFNTHFNLFKIIVVNASHSISSAIITKSFFHSPSNCSKRGIKSFVDEIFPSVISIRASLNSLVIFSLFVTMYGEIYH